MNVKGNTYIYIYIYIYNIHDKNYKHVMTQFIVILFTK